MPRPTAIAALLQRRLVFVTGKGGVGKSTCAMALAVAVARSGKRVLHCELGSRPAAADFLGNVVGHEPTRPRPVAMPNLWCAALDPTKALQEYLIEHLKLPRLVKLATQNKVLARLWQAGPSVNEAALLNSIFRHFHGQSPAGAFDWIVVSLPATGHALAMLGVPGGSFGMLRVGPLAERMRAIDRLLHDTKSVAIVLVTLPEELPVKETIELATQLSGRLRLDPACILVNRVLPVPFDPTEQQLLARLEALVDAGPGRQLLNAVGREAELCRLQQRYIQTLRDRVGAPQVEVEWLPKSGRELLDGMVSAIWSDP